MAFFEDLGKKISHAGQTAVQKTKDMTDIARINGAISDEEKKINNNYYQIGKLYVVTHCDDYESDFAGMVTAVKESEAKIRDYRKQIQDIKGVVRCAQCGAEVANGSAFCSSCGASMPKPTPIVDENMIKCSNCGQFVSKDVRFCTSCGNPMTDILQNQEPAQNIVEVMPADDQPVSPAAKRCPACGTEVADDVAFCTECGTKL